MLPTLALAETSLNPTEQYDDQYISVVDYDVTSTYELASTGGSCGNVDLGSYLLFTRSEQFGVSCNMVDNGDEWYFVVTPLVGDPYQLDFEWIGPSPLPEFPIENGVIWALVALSLVGITIFTYFGIFFMIMLGIFTPIAVFFRVIFKFLNLNEHN